MCLITDQQQPKIAEEDITVYKVLQGMNSPYHSDFTYILGKLYKTDIQEDDSFWCFDASDNVVLASYFGIDWKINRKLKCFGQGFHSALSISRLRESSIAYAWRAYIYECIIPKGSKYYVNPSNLAISNQIIIKRKIEKDELPDN